MKKKKKREQKLLLNKLHPYRTVHHINLKRVKCLNLQNEFTDLAALNKSQACIFNLNRHQLNHYTTFKNLCKQNGTYIVQS